MASICLCFQVHQPYPLRPYSFFDIGAGADYLDAQASAAQIATFAKQCYLPANRKLLQLIGRHGDKFQVAFLVSGVLLEQWERYAPEVIASFRELVDTGCVEMLAGTYYHSLSFLYNREEFFSQILLHRQKVWEHFGQNPRVLANAALLHGNHLGYFARKMGLDGMICEAMPAALRGRNPNHIFHPPDTPTMKLLPRHRGLSEDISLRFSDSGWEHFPLRAETYAQWLRHAGGDVATLYIEYESLGYHHPASSGIFDFWDRLPDTLIQDHGMDFVSPSTAIFRYGSHGGYDVPGFEVAGGAGLRFQPGKDDPLQAGALRKIYELGGVVMASRAESLIRTWSQLQAVDYFSNMNREKNGVHSQEGRPGAFISPYDAYIYFLNIIADFQLRIKSAEKPAG